MAITEDQTATKGETGSGSSVVATWSTNPTAGSSVLVFIQCGNTPTSVVDNGVSPSTFTLDVDQSSFRGALIYRADNISLPASGNYHVTANVAAFSTAVICGKSYLGKASGGPVASSSNSGTSISVSSGSATPTDTGQLAFGGFSDMSGVSPETISFTGGSPLSQFMSETDGNTYWPTAAAEGILTSTAAKAMTWTLGDSVNWDASIAIYAAATTGGTGGGTGPSWDSSGSWTQTFADDFNGSSIDTTKWERGWFGASGITPPVNSESPHNNSANITVSGSAANMKMGAVSGTTYGSLLTTNPNNSATAQGFETGPPAAFEARINLPQNGTGVANWCAWWLNGQSWPDTGEIDILESLGSPDDNTYHIHDATNPDGVGNTHNTSPHPYGWHTFGCYWHDSQVDFYYDGAFVETVATDGFTGPLYLVLTNTYNTTADVNPATMLVDWVKVWTPGGSGGSGGGPSLLMLL